MPVADQPRRRAWPWAVAAALVVGNLFLHEPVSLLCDSLYRSIGRGPYERTTLLAIAAFSVAGAWYLLRGRVRLLAHPRATTCLLALAAVSVAAQRWLLVSNVELIHLPQFALLAALLLAAGVEPQAAFMGAVLGGVVDETYQWLVIYAGVPGTYFDYNDIILNGIGAAWAVVLAAGAGAVPAPESPQRWPRALLVALLAGLALSLWFAPPRVVTTSAFPYIQPSVARAATGFDYHVMPASEGFAALLLLWGLVWTATRAERRRPSAALSAAAMLLGALCASDCAPSPQRVAAPSDQPQWPAAAASQSPKPGVPIATSAEAKQRRKTPFIITFWCGPPPAELTDARAAEIAAAGFNVVGAPCEGIINTALNRRALDVAARHGLTLWIADPRVGAFLAQQADWQARLAEVVDEYRDHPALGGYFLVDEPDATHFDDLGKLVAWLRTGDPARVPYINLLPDFVPPEVLGTPTYREHLEQFVATVQPALLSFDYYPFKIDSDRTTFFDNLELVRTVAQANGLPFLLIVQAMPHGAYRDPTAAEIAWQVNHAVAFGARGVSYFAYWTPVNVPNAERWDFRHGLIENGEPTVHFQQAARINRIVRAYVEQLDGFASLAVADSEGRFGTPLPLGPVAGIDGGPVTAGFFAAPNAVAVMLVNQDYRSDRPVGLRLRPGAALPELFDLALGRWRPLPEATVTLAPGGAQLLRWPLSRPWETTSRNG